MGKRRQEARGGLQNRLRVFLSLMETGWFDNLLLDIDKADAIVKMLDAGVWIWRGGRHLGWVYLGTRQTRVDRSQGPGVVNSVPFVGSCD